ncbi:3D domain-containing protein [Algoriphagus yeomjeoni]|nr:3D domain-containing protein [Algoriphagus yeomjeoni]
MEVVATAYNSVTAQTDGDPSITAWGDTLEPGMKAVAISRDLLDSGLYYNMDITIEGLEGRYKVLDKMNRRWVNKIDIYMGLNVLEARQWGKQYVTISYRPSE